MTLRDARAVVQPGTGVVAHLGDTILVVVPDGPGQEGLVGDLLAVIETDHKDPAGIPAVARRLAALVAIADVGSVPPFCVVSEAPTGVVVFLHGSMDLRSRGGGGPVELSGRDATTWVDRTIDGSFDTLTIGPSGRSEEAASAWGDLHDGIVSGSGVVLMRRPPAGEAPTPAATERTDPTALAVAAPPADLAPPPDPPLAPTDQSLAPTSDPAPGVADPAPPAAADPEAAWLVLDTGAAFRLDRNYVLGRAPEEDPAVDAGDAQPILLDDPDRVVSRIHARIACDGGRVVVLDAGSANGTLVAHPEGEWARIEPDRAEVLRPGTRILLGERSLIVEGQRPPEPGP